MAFTNDQLAHVWVSGDRSTGRTSNGTMSFDGATLYSYSTPIARFVTDAVGGRVALVTTETFSKTTSGKHMPAVRNALRGAHVRTFWVPSVALSDIPAGRGTRGSHESNLAALVVAYEAEKVGARRARIEPFGFADRPHTLADDAREYATVFALDLPSLSPLVDASEIAVARLKRDEARNTPEARAKRAAADARKAAKQATHVVEWMAGTRHYLTSDEDTDGNGGAFLRVQGETLYTSRGASVPLEHAIRVFRFVRRIRDAKENWQSEGSATVRAGHFVVDRVFSDGSFRAGCHLINWPEIERVARLVGVFEAVEAEAV